VLVRRALLPLALSAAYVVVHCIPRDATPLPAAIDEAMPQAAESYVVADAPRTIEELRERLAKVLAHENLSGAAFSLVDRNGPIYVGGLGVRDRATGEPVEVDTVFRVGSLSKSVIALGVMRLVDQGKLDVDRPLREIVPDLGIDNPWENVAPVTLAQCLEHTAGFDDMQLNELFAEDERISVRETLAINPRSRRVRYQPGTRHAYSNVGYTIAARAIEVATGEPFDEYLRREVLAPIGIVEADFRRSGTLGARLATGYMTPERPVVYRSFAHRPAGGLLASASDLAKLTHFWLVRGDGYPPIVSAAGLARIERSGTLPYPHVDAEYGFANYADVMHPVIARGHDGGMPGFHSSFRYFPSLGVGYTMSVNSNYTFRGYFQIRALLFAYLTQGRQFPSPEVAMATERPGATYFRLAKPQNGLFGFVDRALAGWHVTDHVDHLDLTWLGGGSAKLIPTVDGGYRFRGNSGSSVRFTTNASGAPIALFGFTYTEPGSETAGQLRYAALGLTMALMHLAPLWSLLVLLLGLANRRRLLPSAVVLWPAVAGLSGHAVSVLLDHAFFSGVIGKVHPVTVGLCGMTILFGVASVATLVVTIRAVRRPDRPDILAIVFPIAFGLAFFGMALWLCMNGFIGLRTWA
jgi:CubicO group peptidase (beta-lactamase class C family)